MIAGVVAMIPEGLVLLTSLAFAVAAVALARRRVLVQELPAVEGLARVDVVVLDKTGTITEGVMRFDSLEAIGDHDAVADALGRARRRRGPQRHDAGAVRGVPARRPDGPAPASVPFSSARKWSAATFGDARHVGARRARDGLGRPAGRRSGPGRASSELAADGRRVLLLARYRRASSTARRCPSALDAAALVLFDEQIRADAADTIRYFAEQGVACKVVSGDSPRTVGAVAARVGIAGAEHPVDGRDLPEDLDALGELLETHLGDRPGDAAPEARDRRRAPATRSRRRDDG